MRRLTSGGEAVEARSRSPEKLSGARKGQPLTTPTDSSPSEEERHPARRLGAWTRLTLGVSRTRTLFSGGRFSAERFSVGRQVLLVVMSALFMALLAPFDMTGIPIGRRLVYWLGLMTAGTVLANLIGRYAVRMDLYERLPWGWAALVAAVLTAPMTVVVWVATGLAFRDGLDPRLIPSYGLPVLIVTSAMVAVTVLMQRTPPQTHAGVVGSPAPAFLERLPAKLRGAELYAVEAEDHYLRLHTSRGEDLILMRLADALGELEGMEGARVHRSWWVARAAVDAAERDAGRASLTLKSGVVAPVSRTYARALREAGWY